MTSNVFLCVYIYVMNWSLMEMCKRKKGKKIEFMRATRLYAIGRAYVYSYIMKMYLYEYIGT